MQHFFFQLLHRVLLLALAALTFVLLLALAPLLQLRVLSGRLFRRSDLAASALEVSAWVVFVRRLARDTGQNSSQRSPAMFNDVL